MKSFAKSVQPPTCTPQPVQRQLMTIFITTVLFLLVLSSPEAQVTAILIKKQQVLNNPPFKSCHASTICEAGDGSLIAAWFGGEFEGHKMVSIWTARYGNGKWSQPVKQADGNDSVAKNQYPCWNPVLYRNADGRLFLYYKVGPSPRQWWGMMKHSDDSGKTWSSPSRLPEGFLGPIKNKPITLSTGNILHPSSTESLDEKSWTVHMERSDKISKNWKMIAIDCDTFGVIQPTLLKWPGNRLQLLARSRQNVIVEAWSNNEGESWSALSKTSVINPNSGIDAVTTKSGLQVLVYNPGVKGKEWYNGRNRLAVAVSEDGSSWKDVYQLEDQTAGEYSYPAVIESSDGVIHITYTNDRKNITHAVLRLQLH